jgi:hypothetical protein
MADRKTTPPESPLAMAERHVREGQARIARQREVLTEMRADNHPHAAAEAEAILTTFLKTQELAEAHWAQLQGKAQT